MMESSAAKAQPPCQPVDDFKVCSSAPALDERLLAARRRRTDDIHVEPRVAVAAIVTISGILSAAAG